MEEHIAKIKGILQQFQAEEIGNRLSAFAILALSSLIEQELTRIQKKWEDKTAVEKAEAKGVSDSAPAPDSEAAIS